LADYIKKHPEAEQKIIVRNRKIAAL